MPLSVYAIIHLLYTQGALPIRRVQRRSLPPRNPAWVFSGIDDDDVDGDDDDDDNDSEQVNGTERDSHIDCSSGSDAASQCQIENTQNKTFKFKS